MIRALERSPEVGRIVGMARRPFDPAEHGWKRTEYRRGDVLDRASVDALVDGADVVVHLAFIIFGGRDETREINLTGSRNVFEAAVAAGAQRLVYTSSVAAYGFHDDNPDVLTEDVPPRGTRDFYYSAQKAELEGLLDDVAGESATDTYVFRPCIVAGRDAPTLVEGFTGQTILGPRVRKLWRALDAAPLIGPVLPDIGTPFQLVHHDDVATAIRAAVVGQGRPGTYNLAAASGDHGRRCRRRARLARGPGPASGARCARRGRVAGAAGPRPGALDQRDPQAGADGHQQGAPRAALAAEARRARHAARDGRWRARRRRGLRHPCGPACCPTTRSSASRSG